ncbi:hypothetical protein C8R43DRAFT_1147990 [Mycena crocata]|nr:hypothetical protein C8R43DRAFT_1147990 [Mycena crocata]
MCLAPRYTRGMQYLSQVAVMGCCLRSDFCCQRQRTAATSKQCIPPNLGVLKIRDRRAAAAITTPPRMEVLQCVRAHRVELKPPRSGGGNDYPTYRNPASGGQIPFFAAGGQHPAMTSKYRISPTASISRPPASRRVAAAEAVTRRIEIPRAGSNSNFCRRRPTPRYGFKAPYFPKHQNLPRTCEPPRSGGGNNYTMYRNPASGGQIRFFAAGGQRPATTSKQHMSLNDGISCAPASRRGAALYLIPQCFEIRQAGFLCPLFAAGGQNDEDVQCAVFPFLVFREPLT